MHTVGTLDNLRQKNFLGDGLNALARGRGAEPCCLLSFQHREYGAAEKSSDYLRYPHISSRGPSGPAHVCAPA